MKLHIWTDRFSFLAVAHADSVATARRLMMETSDIGESGDGSCPERDRARRIILGETPGIYFGEIAEFSLSDSASARENETKNEELHKDLAVRDRRIAELEAALKNFYAGHQGCSDPERDDCQCRDCLAYRAYKVGNTPVLDAALAAAKREALDRCIAIARGCEDYGGGYCDGKELDIYHHGMQTVQRCLIQLREGDDSYQFRTVERIGGRMAREVKP